MHGGLPGSPSGMPQGRLQRHLRPGQVRGAMRGIHGPLVSGRRRVVRERRNSCLLPSCTASHSFIVPLHPLTLKRLLPTRALTLYARTHVHKHTQTRTHAHTRTRTHTRPHTYIFQRSFVILHQYLLTLPAFRPPSQHFRGLQTGLLIIQHPGMPYRPLLPGI